MPVNKTNLKKAIELLGADHAKFIRLAAEEQDRLEQKWQTETIDLGRNILDRFEDGKWGDTLYMVKDFVWRHYMDVIETADDSAQQEVRVIDHEKRMARPKMPRSIADVRKAYDLWRRTGRMPKSLADRAEKIQDLYLKKVHQVWRRYSEDYRNGGDVVKAEIEQKVRKAAEVATSRAKNIVRTETTNHYNEARTEIYDQSDGIWGYLFLAIRDQATTKWCTDRVRGGKRGRHGLVYKKGDPLTTKERPSCHWNCRSEFAPLTIFNPRHKKLINDESKHRRSHTCHPLPEGWR